MKRPLRILAADDSAVMRSILWKLFLMHAEDRSSELPRMELCGVARDGVECLELVEQLRPDVLVLDLEMPRLNGLEVLDRLRVENPAAAGDHVQRVYGAWREIDAGGAGARRFGLCDEAVGATDFADGDAVAIAAAAAANCRAGEGRDAVEKRRRIELHRPIRRR